MEQVLADLVILRETKDLAQVCIFNFGKDSLLPAQNANRVRAMPGNFVAVLCRIRAF